jgi:hypothetical protein
MMLERPGTTKITDRQEEGRRRHWRRLLPVLTYKLGQQQYSKPFYPKAAHHQAGD